MSRFPGILVGWELTKASGTDLVHFEYFARTKYSLKLLPFTPEVD